MNMRPVVPGLAIALALAASAPPVSAQTLHTNHRWSQCAIALHPSLTQEAWRQFTSELGLVTYFRPLASAEPLGRGSFEVALLNWGTRIDDSDAAWNDTFSHPDSTHWLFEGDALFIPGLMVRAGITDRVDLGAYFTKAIGANYGFIGGQLQYNLLNDAERHLAAAGRLSVVNVFGPEDMTATTYGLDLVLSREFGVVAPYVGIAGYMSRARETTPNVDLDDVTAFGAQASVGLVASVSVLRLGGELNLAKVPGMSMKVGVGL